jgi:hypothetical protein
MNKCGIVKDLLPLYADNVCTLESKKFVAEHLAECEECCKELDSYTLDIKTTSADEKNAVKKFKRKTERRVAVKVISLVLAICIGVFGVFNVYWYAVFKAPLNKYEKMANEYFHEYKEKDITPIEAVLGKDNSYGIDISEYEELGFDVGGSDYGYYTNGGFIEVFTNRTGSHDEILYSDKDALKDVGISIQVTKNNDRKYEYLVMFEWLVDEDDNEVYFYIDENMNLILNTEENYGVNFYHDLNGQTEKELQYKHNDIREEIYQEVYEDLSVMMIVLYEGFGIGNVKA